MGRCVCGRRVGHGASGGQRGAHAGEVGEPAVVAAVLFEGLEGGACLALERRHDRHGGGLLGLDLRAQVVQPGQRALGVRVEQRQVRGSVGRRRRALGRRTAGALGLGGCPVRREGVRLLGERLVRVGVRARARIGLGFGFGLGLGLGLG